MKRSTVPVRVVLYTREGCHLCEQARDVMLNSPCVDHFTLEEVDTDRDDALKSRFGFDIPVVFIEGVQAFKYHVRADEFCRKIAKAAGRES